MSEQSENHGECVARFYRSHAAKLILYGRALGLSHDEAEDSIHEIFAALLKRDSMPPEPEFYCLRAMRNRSVSLRRSLWRRLRREWESGHWFEPSNARPDQEQAAMHFLAKLPQDQREVIVLKIWHGLTFANIGKLLDISPNTAAGRYRYGLQKIKTCFEEKKDETTERSENTTPVLASAPSIPAT